MDSHQVCAVLGVKLTDWAGALQPSCRYFPMLSNSFLARTGLQRLFPLGQLVENMAWDYTAVREFNWAPHCHWLIRREVL